jgi:hypothetical protein
VPVQRGKVFRGPFYERVIVVMVTGIILMAPIGFPWYLDLWDGFHGCWKNLANDRNPASGNGYPG